jgi:hypothetical protein
MEEDAQGRGPTGARNRGMTGGCRRATDGVRPAFKRRMPGFRRAGAAGLPERTRPASWAPPFPSP